MSRGARDPSDAAPRPRVLRRAPLPEDDPGGEPGRDRWLLSYADFMTLLLALFVVLYASAAVEEGLDASLLEGMQAAFVFDGRAAVPVPAPSEHQGAPPIEEEELAPVPYLAALEEGLESVLDEWPPEAGDASAIRVERSERGLVISLATAEFFPAGGVEIPPERREALGAIAPLLASNTASIHFEGHTDDRPIDNAAYPSNWELSAARAAAVARLFIEEHDLDPTRVATTGYAEFRPLEPNDEAGRRARNRRVEIVVLEDGVLVANDDGVEPMRDQLDQLLEVLPPIPQDVDESLRPPSPGRPPADIPLP